MQFAPRARTLKSSACDQRIPCHVCCRAKGVRSGHDKYKEESQHFQRAYNGQLQKKTSLKGSPLKVLQGQDKSMSQEQVVLLSMPFPVYPTSGPTSARSAKYALQPCWNAHLMKRVLDIGRAHKPVSSVLWRSQKFDMSESLACKQRSRRSARKFSTVSARASRMNLCVQQHLQQTRRKQLYPDRERNPRGVAGCAGRLDQHNDQLVPTGFPCQQPQKQDAYAAYTYPGEKRAELVSNDTRLEALETSCGRATRQDCNKVCDPGADAFGRSPSLPPSVLDGTPVCPLAIAVSACQTRSLHSQPPLHSFVTNVF